MTRMSLYYENLFKRSKEKGHETTWLMSARLAFGGLSQRRRGEQPDWLSVRFQALLKWYSDASQLGPSTPGPELQDVGWPGVGTCCVMTFLTYSRS